VFGLKCTTVARSDLGSLPTLRVQAEELQTRSKRLEERGHRLKNLVEDGVLLCLHPAAAVNVVCDKIEAALTLCCSHGRRRNG
jgi:hypothetical protein